MPKTIKELSREIMAKATGHNLALGVSPNPRKMSQQLTKEKEIEAMLRDFISNQLSQV